MPILNKNLNFWTVLQTRHCSLFLEECFLTLFFFFWFRCFFCYDVSFNLYDQMLIMLFLVQTATGYIRLALLYKTANLFCFVLFCFFNLWPFCHLFVWFETMDHRQSLLNSIFFCLTREKKKKTLVGYICVDEIENGKLSGFFTWN